MKISDFKIAEYLIRNLCKRCGTQFIDVPVYFSGLPKDTNATNAIFVTDYGKLSKTLFQIITSYLQNMATVTGSPSNLTNEEKTAYITYVAGILRELSYAKNSFPEAFISQPTLLYANRQPFVWIMLSKIICPSFNIPFHNIRIIAAKSGQIDVAKFITADESASKEPYIFLNNEVENQGVRSAYLIYTCLKALDAENIFSQIISKEEIWKKIVGLTQMAMLETGQVNDFIMTFSMLSNFSDIDNVLEQKKEAKWHKKGLWVQSQESGNLWWQLGLVEKMLGSHRGPDWSGYFITKPFIDDLWQRVETEKKKRGLRELPMELLLRVQSEEYHQTADTTIQKMLSDDRVW